MEFFEPENPLEFMVRSFLISGGLTFLVILVLVPELSLPCMVHRTCSSSTGFQMNWSL